MLLYLCHAAVDECRIDFESNVRRKKGMLGNQLCANLGPHILGDIVEYFYYIVGIKKILGHLYTLNETI
jgi:hypothetical protein